MIRQRSSSSDLPRSPRTWPSPNTSSTRSRPSSPPSRSAGSPPDQQKAVREASATAILAQRAMATSAAATALETLKQNGVQVHTIDRAALTRRGQAALDQFHRPAPGYQTRRRGDPEGLTRLRRSLAHAERLLAILVSAACALVLLGGVGIVFAGVVSRYLLGDQIEWSDEAAISVLIATTFLGSALTLQRGEHLGIRVLRNPPGAALGRAGRRVFGLGSCWRSPPASPGPRSRCWIVSQTRPRPAACCRPASITGRCSWAPPR